MAFLERGKWVAFAAMSNKRNTTNPMAAHKSLCSLSISIFLNENSSSFQNNEKKILTAITFIYLLIVFWKFLPQISCFFKTAF